MVVNINLIRSLSFSNNISGDLMKILLTTLNSKFIHIALALWYLYQYCRNDYPGLYFREFNINQDLAWVCGEIYSERADIIAFSCNIWNIELILTICRRIKSVAPETIIILGGTEVSANPREILFQNPAVDFIVAGEGELTFKEWLEEISKDNPDWSSIPGLIFRWRAGIIENEPRPLISDLSILPFPYPPDLTMFRRKLVYYETSRGCPFRCQYCLSANEAGISNRVRYFPWERVKEELLSFVEAEIAQVKLVDRSFNCDPEHAKRIWRLLIDHPGKTNFHFEIVGDRLDDESIAILESAPPGLFKFEIGVQTTNPRVLELIQRRMDFAGLGRQVAKLLKNRNVFVHLDLIAGLPGEDYVSFGKTFNDNMALRPDRLQLGFLKLLKGSGLRKRAAEYGYVFTAEAPYEVMGNLWISYPELLKLKVIEDLLERYYNSGQFTTSFRYLFTQYPDPFQLFEQLAGWWKKRGFDQYSHKDKDLYVYLLQFHQTIKDKDDRILRNLLKYDLLIRERMVESPEWADGSSPELKDFGRRFWRVPGNIERFVPELAGLTAYEIQRRVVFAEFDFDPVQWAKNPTSAPVLKSMILLFVYGGKKARTATIGTVEKLTDKS